MKKTTTRTFTPRKDSEQYPQPSRGQGLQELQGLQGFQGQIGADRGNRILKKLLNIAESKKED